MDNYQHIASFIRNVADDVLRDDFKRLKYPEIILPFTVLRCVDCVLAPTKEDVLQKYNKLKGYIKDLDTDNTHSVISSLKNNHQDTTFDTMIYKPSYGISWTRERSFTGPKYNRASSGRFQETRGNIKTLEVEFLEIVKGMVG